jgi:membrane-bound ClpP family serine protease
MSPYILLFLGLVLIFLEFFLPGAILGICGGILVLWSIISFAMESGSPIMTVVYIIAIGIILIYLVKFALWKIRHSSTRFSIYSNDDQQGYQASEFDHSAIGKIGIVSTDLKPGGFITVDGKQQQAISQSGYLVKGTEVLVIGGQEESLIVKQNKKEIAS